MHVYLCHRGSEWQSVAGGKCSPAGHSVQVARGPAVSPFLCSRPEQKYFSNTHMHDNVFIYIF
jgi:hypothetical protein